MIVFKTTFNTEATTSLEKFSIKKTLWLFVLLSAIILLIGVLILLDGDSLTGVLIMLFGIIFVPLILIIFKSAQKKERKSMSVLSDDTEQTFIFKEDGVEIETVKGDDYFATVKAKYSFFFKVEETKTHYFFYISTAQCHVIEKDTLVEGTLEELELLLLDKLGDKFKPLS